MEDDDPQHPRRFKYWIVREPEYSKCFVADKVYSGYDNLFTLKVYHGGVFTDSPHRKYVNGRYAYVDYCNVDEFSVHEVNFIVRELKLDTPKVEIYYHFQIPGQDLDSGLHPLGNDGDVLVLAKYVAKNKVIKMFIEHGFTRLQDYFSPPKTTNVVIEEIEDESNVSKVVKPRKKLRVSKKLYLDWKKSDDCSSEPSVVPNVDVSLVSGSAIEDIDNTNQLVGSNEPDEINVDSVDVNERVIGGNETVNEEVLAENVSVHEEVIERHDTINEDVIIGNETGNEEVIGCHETVNEEVIGASFNEGFSYDFDNADFSNEFPMSVGQDNDNEGEFECEHEGSCGDESEHESECEDDDDSDDSDFKADLNTMMEDAEVDMREYRDHVDHGEEFVRGFNESVGNNEGDGDESDDPLAAEYMNYDSLDSLTEDSMDELKSSRSKKLRDLNKKKDNQKETSKITFYIGQMFGSAKQAKECINKHAIETRRSLSSLRNDKRRIRVVFEGNVPIYTSGPLVGPSNQNDSGPSQTCETSGTSVNKKESKKGLEACNDKRKGRLNSVDCPWLLYISKLNEDEETWVVKTYKPEHKCLQSRKIQPFTSTFMAKEQWVLNQLQSNPNVSVKAIQEELARKYELGVSKMKAFRAKLKATRHIQGDFQEQYSRLRDYALELMQSNPGTTVKLGVEPECNPDAPTRIFKRIYICLGPLKQGFKECRKELLGLDGAFMKGPYPGQMLTAVGLDPNNGIYPLAYAIVEAKNKDSWSWFLENLQDDLDLASNSHFTFISDRQKGLIPAIADIFPAAEHRFYLRHIHQNMKLQWRGKAFKDCLWDAACSTTVPEFQLKMEELKKYNPEAYNWLSSIPPVHWTKSHFTGRAKTDVLLNNMCEVLNARTVDGRDKPIIVALEYVREYLMQRIVNVIKKIQKCNGPLTPNITERLDENKEQAVNYTVKWGGGTKYQVSGKNNSRHSQYVVDVVDKVCSCREWEVSGIPCRHAIAVNWDMALNGQEVGPPESWVNECYFLDTWKKVYAHHICPINGRDLWPKSQCPTTLTPPLHHKPIGRPKKKRRKDQVELQDENERGKKTTSRKKKKCAVDDASNVEGVAGKLTRKWKTVTCKTCGGKGHNSRSCKDKGKSSSQAKKGKEVDQGGKKKAC